MLKDKEGFIPNLMLDVCRYTGANEKLEKKLKDADLQMVESMKKIQELPAEVKDLRKIRDAAGSMIDLVDPVAEDSAVERSLLQETPREMSAYMTETTKSYVSIAFGC